ncbi:short-chain dehydrogenase [Neoasaia chiangmaiensis NBRC 101099]|uniref:Short-chain dehydrogenase n=1 Tax=Neoasaia chiangmaiensis TaxID=320497 RepID=A0A1U9KQQ3_9PROT|nr:glucose 1-dehydrogenase [Neoasaia chiangmaiensis]AQS88148.1 short-chain dehydrogenase [Neoasaia chiangmaiensis]GBR40000.1 short-chain dehydrogenase [Neoasaia chiangmaiensis NBRC 101099]GEN14838.1 oxidoreductase [Neoasaia chiangmaiensis]
MRLQNKIALITGGNSGIGLATAERFIEEGAKVVITGRNQETLDAAAAKLGPNAVAVRADITDDAAIKKAITTAVDHFGGLDIVFANAGIPGATPLGGTDRAGFEHILNTNLTSAFFTVQAALPHLKSGASVILNGSVHQVLGIPGASAYAASKGGIGAMNRVLASELAPRGIRVNSVVPGATRTPIWSTRASTPEAVTQLEAGFARAIPLGQWSEAVDIANAIVFLASDEAKSITATEIVVDGGTIGAPAGAPVYRPAA